MLTKYSTLIYKVTVLLITVVCIFYVQLCCYMLEYRHNAYVELQNQGQVFV